MPFRVEDRVDRRISLYAATKKADELMSEISPDSTAARKLASAFHRLWPLGRPNMAV